MPESTLLGFDYGTKQIGVAYGHKATHIASPVGILKARDGQPNWDEIAQLISEWKPELLLVGLPLNMDDSEGELCIRARKFARRLHGRFGLKVKMIDERLSTYEAKQHINNKKQLVDAEAARLLVKCWLSSPELTLNP